MSNGLPKVLGRLPSRVVKDYMMTPIIQLGAGDTQGRNGVTVSYEFTDLWTDVREWSVRPV